MSSRPSRPPPLFVSGVALKDVRAFRELDVKLSDHLPRQLTIIGRNGTCKTTLLRCIALALCDHDVGALLASPNGSLVRDGATSATIRLTMSDGSARTVTILRDGDKDYLDHYGFEGLTRETVDPQPGDLLYDASGPFVCGYGLDRGRQGSEFGRSWRAFDSVSTLFGAGTLVDSELILRRLQDWLGDEAYRARLKAVGKALGLPDAEFSFARGGGVRITGKGIGESIPLEALADGYRLTFAWMLDFLGWAMRANALNEEGQVRGVLLIDEVEQHLHPAVQGGVLERLGQLLPEVQVICTTHSPLVALGATEGQLVALHRDAKGISARQPGDLSAYSAEDALVSETLFGTDPFAPRTRRKLDQRDKLASVPPADRTARQTATLREVSAELHESVIASLGDDPVLEQLRALQATLRAETAE